MYRVIFIFMLALELSTGRAVAESGSGAILNNWEKAMNRMPTSASYVKSMIPFLRALPQFLRTPEGHSELLYYGTGESASWPVQSNMNVCAALAVLAADPDFEQHHPTISRNEARAIALKLFRYAMRTHVTGDLKATDGKQWGRHWISVLGAERMTHGINALEPYMTADDKARYKVFRLAESDWLLDEYPVQAGFPVAVNKPESNIWNGGFLLRTALDYPDAPRAEQYREKACAFLLNGISIPSDAQNDKLFRGRPLSQWFVGANFTENYSLNHHGYMNVGYMAVCLSNIAMLHFNFKERGQTPPPELYHHAKELWLTLKKFLWPDGRLLRIGGDSRSRYTYCQCFLMPVLLFAAEHFGDRDAARMEQEWLKVVVLEQHDNADGTYFGKRLSSIRDISWFYYSRLESDQFLALSCGAYWRRRFAIPEPLRTAVDRQELVWSDEAHGAVLIRQGNVARSWVRNASQGQNGMCVPLNDSSLGEWQGNLLGHITGNLIGYRDNAEGKVKLIPGGFLYSGKTLLDECLPMGEGEQRYHVAEIRIGVAALPDGKTMLIAQRGKVIKETTLHGIDPLYCEIPNDVFNGYRREYRGGRFHAVLPMSESGNEEIVDTNERKLNVDNRLSIFLLSGGKSLKIVRPGRRNVILCKASPPEMASLYADLITADPVRETRRWRPGEILFDVVYAVSADTSADDMLHMSGESSADDALRMVSFRDSDGFVYRFQVNFDTLLLSLTGE